MEFVDNVELAMSVPPALSAMGLGQAAAYLEKHPEYLNAALNHSDWAIRAAAVQVQGKQHSSIESFESLLRALHDENVSVRATATRTLGLQGKQAPVEPLIGALKDPEWRVRTAAAQALGRLKDRTPVEPLLPMLHDENASVRAAVVWALGRLGKQAPTEQLVIALQDKAWAVREAAVMALQESNEQASIGHLLAARWDEDSSVRSAADDALGQHFREPQGEKMVPAGTSWLSPSLLRLVLAVMSVCILIPLTNVPANPLYIGRFAIVSEIVATAIVCLGIALINILYQRSPAGGLSAQKSPQQKGATTSWHNIVLAGISVFTLGQVVSSLLQTTFATDPAMTADTVHFILICRLIALGIMVATVIVINKVFFVRN
jgi:hypothetical protein